MNKRTRTLLILLTLCISTTSIRAAWGDLDTSFGFLGASLDGVSNHYPEAVALQADGKILVAGYRLVAGKKRFFLRRYLSSGQLDTSFGNSGAAVSNALINVEADYIGEKIVVQANGRIAVMGIGNNRPTIWRFTSTGSADTSIGMGGMKTLSAYRPAGSTDSIATYSNILYVGVRTDTNPATTVILKFNSGGSQDTSFGAGGEATTAANNYFTLATDPTTGNILIGGRNVNETDFGISRLLTTGQLDPSFNHWDAVFDGNILASPYIFLRLSNGEFAFNDRWIMGTGPYGFDADIAHFSARGAADGLTQYVNDPPWSSISGSCPDIFAQQQDARLIAKAVNNDELFRFSADFATIETMTCGSHANLQSPTRAILQPDDKMLVAGRYNDNIAIIRTLP